MEALNTQASAQEYSQRIQAKPLGFNPLEKSRLIQHPQGMKLWRVFGWLLIGLVSLTGCKKPGAGTNSGAEAVADWSGPHEAQPRLPTIKLWLGPEEMVAETAVTAKEIMTGMMFRTNMDANEGMIFALPYTQRGDFWMKNCYIPLSVAYIDPDGVIQEIHDMQPQNTNSILSATDNIRFALETPQGWFKRHHIGPGVVVRTEHGTLMNTFFPNR